MAPFDSLTHHSRSTHDVTPVNHANKILATCVCCSIFMVLFLGIRLTSKRMKRTKFDWDDGMLIASLIFAIFQNGMFAWGAFHCAQGMNRSEWSPADEKCFLRGFLPAEIIQPTSLALAKLSLLYLLEKIFHVTRFRIALRILVAIVILWWLGNILSAIFGCWPIASRWDPDIKGNCGDLRLLIVVTPIPWLVTDFAILIAPMFVLRTLHLPLAKKAAVFGMFGFGGVTCIISCLRYTTVWKDNRDPDFNSTPTIIWSVVESSITIICVSIIASKPLLQLLIPDALINRSASWIKSYFPRKGSNDSPSNMRTPSWLRSWFSTSKDSSKAPSGPMYPLEDSSQRSLRFQTEHPSARRKSTDDSGATKDGTFFLDTVDASDVDASPLPQLVVGASDPATSDAGKRNQ